MKRGASEYITKENGSTPNSDTTDSEGNTSKMANAAQLARRKMAVPKSRVNRSTTPTGGSGGPTSSNPFSTASFSAQQTHSFNPPSSAFTFGGAGTNPSMSFPPASQQSSSFSIPGGSSSFTFGMGNQNNPFANTNGTLGSEGNGNADNNMMDASPQKPSSSSVFNFGTSSQSGGSGGLLFGQQQASAQQQQTTPTFGSGLFGQSTTKPEESKPESAFGQSSQPLTNGFGSSTTSSAFGQGSQQSSTAFGGFGQPSQPPSSSSQPQGSIFSFGASPAQPSESTDTQTQRASSPFSFGAPASKPQETSSSQSQPFAGLFGAKASPAFGSAAPESTPPTTSQDNSSSHAPATSATSSPPVFSFGTPATSQPAALSDAKPVFGNPTPNIFGKTQKNDESTSASSSSAAFGQPKHAQVTESEKDSPKDTSSSNPFAGLFGSQPGSTASAEKPNTPFSFGKSPAFGSSAKTGADGAPNVSDSSTSKPIFSFGTPATSDTPSSSALFNLNKPTPSAEPSSTETNAPENSVGKSAPSPSKRLFGNTLPAFGTPISKPSDSSPASSATVNPFASKETPSVASASTAGVPATSSEVSFTPKQPVNLFGSTPVATQSSQSKSTLFGSMPSAHQSSSSTPSSKVLPPAQASGTSNKLQPSTPVPAPPKQEDARKVEPIKRTVSTEGPPQIPRFTDPAKYVSYDENWRLKALNREFKDAIVKLNPDRHDFLLQVRNYLDHREAIGQGMGIYERAKAGSKRKATDVDDMQEELVNVKKQRPVPSQGLGAGSTPSQETPKTVTGSNPFAGLFSPQAKHSATTPKSAGDTQTSQLFRSMIPGAQTATTKKTTTPPSSPPKKVAPEMPKFSMPATSTHSSDFASAFAKQAESSVKKMEAEAKAKRKAEDFDSDEEDEAAWEKRYDEEQKAKKAKASDAQIGGFKPNFGSSSATASKHLFTFGAPTTSETTSNHPTPSFKFGESASNSENSSEKPIEIEEVDSGESEEVSGEEQGSEYAPGSDEQEDDDDLPEDDVDGGDEEEEDEEGSEVPDLPPSQSLFGRITRPGQPGNSSKPAADSPLLQPAANSSFKPGLMFSNVGNSTPDKPGFSPLTPATTSKSSFVPATTFNFTSTPATASSSSTPVAGASLFEGGAVREGPILGEGLFGSRPSTPLNGDQPRTSLFGTSQISSTSNDKTWKLGSGIRFGSPDKDGTSTPSLEVTQATPPAKSNPFSGLFGNPVKSASPAPSGANGGAAPVGFTFGSSSLFPPSSGISSRATSPGLTDNESVATDNTEDYSNEPQTSLMATSAGEENEDSIFESRAQAQRLYKADEIPEGTKVTAGWNKVGLGNLKILKHKNTDKVRILLRAEPSANILMNARLMKGVDYKAQAVGKNGGAVTFAVVGESGKMQSWMLQVKTMDMAKRLASLLEENKDN